MADLLLEIGCEEIPSGEIDPAIGWLKKEAENRLKHVNLDFKEVQSFGTPRRLVLIVKSLAAKQADKQIEVTGPKAEVAFLKEGTLSKAGAGFVRSKGRKPSEAFVKKTPKGEMLALSFKEKGLESKNILPGLLCKLIQDIPFSKTMKWDESQVRFIRPVRWLLCLYLKKVLPVTFGSLKAQAKTCGHRYLSPKFSRVTSLESYLAFLKKNWVMLDGNDRKKQILKEAKKLALSKGGCFDPDSKLLETVKNLVEYPWPMLGAFEKKYLEIPAEILVCEMQDHQRYFPLKTKSGKLLPGFIFVAGAKPKNKKELSEGNARVIRARFEDGGFYFFEDKKLLLQDFVPKLDKLAFQVNLGTMFEKTKRIESLAVVLADSLRLKKEEKADLKRAAYLCKADLLTGVVAQFPELQGTMGGKYAKLSGEKSAVTTAISEHYAPVHASDDVPSSVLGAVLSASDRLDSLVGVMSLGKKAKGNADPFGLRRAAIGLIRVIAHFKWRVSLNLLIDSARACYEKNSSLNHVQVKAEVLKFIKGRFRGYLLESFSQHNSNYLTLMVDGVLDVEGDDLFDMNARVLTLVNLEKKNPNEFALLVETYKRVSHIIQKAKSKDKQGTLKSNRELLKEKCEIKLTQLLEETKSQIKEKKKEKDLLSTHMSTLKGITLLKPAIDRFFDEVMVMDKDLKLRQARLGLLAEVEALTSHFANFSKF